jgi:hypothetical protein
MECAQRLSSDAPPASPATPCLPLATPAAGEDISPEYARHGGEAIGDDSGAGAAAERGTGGGEDEVSMARDNVVVSVGGLAECPLCAAPVRRVVRVYTS